MSTTALIPAFSVMATAGVMLAMPGTALAQTSGGRGGNNLGSGGASSENSVGGDGAGNANSGGGGGGGAGVTGGKGGNGGGAGGASAGANGSAGGTAGSGGGGGAHGYFGATVLGTAAIGGNGGAGAVSAAGANRGGGGGGAGGFGAVITGTGNLGTLTVNVLGGTGGLGGNGGTGSFGGYGGSGGVGLALTGSAASLTINGSVTGGNGGSGGAIGSAGSGAAGVAGNGGVGLHVLGANSIVTIGSSSSVTGGNSGPALNGAGQSNGGIGITGSNLTLVVGGSVRGGTGVFGRANAVSLTGGTNVLEILSGATFLGNVVANSASDTLRLGGTASGTFDASLIGSAAQFRNFGVYEKTGTSTWTLTGSNSAATPWAINGGTLSIASDGALGASGPISFNGGTLATTALFTSARNITLNAGGGTISPASATALTLSGIISGAGALTKADAGALVLSGQNSYLGGTIITDGLLFVSSDENLGAAGTGVSIGNATFEFNNSFSTSRAFTLTGTSTIGVSSSQVGTVTSFIGGAGSLIKRGLGTLVLTGDNTYAGTTTTIDGVLQIGNGGTTGTLGLGDVTNNATLIFDRSNDLTVANAITGSGAVIKNGVGTVTLTGQKAYTGRTTINAGTLALRGTLPFTGGGPLTLSGGTLDMGVDGNFGSVTHSSGSLALDGRTLNVSTGNYTFQNGSITGGGAIALLGNNRNLNISLTGTSIASDVTIRSEGINNVVSLSGLSGDFMLAANLDGSGASGTPGSLTLNITNAGFTTTISGNNNHRAGTIVNAGTLAVGSDTALGTGTLFLNPNTVLTSVGLRSIANPVNLFANGIAIRNTDTSNPFTLGGVISNAGFTKTGAGTLILTGANTYTAGTTVSEGTLQIGAGGTSGALGSGAVTNNAILVFNRSDDATFSNIISGTGTLRKLGAGVTTLSSAITQGSVVVEAGTLALNAANTIGGITVAGGTLRLGASGAAGGAGGLITTTGSVIDYANGITNATPITLNSNTTQLQVTTGAATQSGVISETGGARPLEKIGAGALFLTGINSYSGGTTISAGSLIVGADTALGGASGGLTIGNATLALDSTQNSARAVNLTGSAVISMAVLGNWNFGGAVTGTGSLTKDGAGTLVLSGTNSYAGATTISFGTLQIGAGGTTGTLGTGAVTNNASLVFNRSNDLTVANLISGTGSVTKLGAGVLTLSGNNAYSGGTTISAGTLQLGSGAQPASLGSGPVSIATGASLRFDGAGSKTITGAISGGGSVTVGGTGTATLNSATGSFTGGTTVNSGRLALAGTTSAGTGVIRMNGGTLRANSAFSLANELIIAAGADVRLETNLGSQTLTLANQPSAPGRSGFNLLGTLRIAAASGGTIQFSAGSVSVADAAQLIIESGTLLNTTSVTLPGILDRISLTQIGFGATLNLGGQSGGGILNLRGGGILRNDGATTTIRGGNFTGNISGTQNIISTGALTLSGLSDYTGTTTVQSGTLTVAGTTNVLGVASGGTIVQNGATLAFSRNLGTGTGDAITVGGTGVGGLGALRAIAGEAVLSSNISLSADTLISADAPGSFTLSGSPLTGNNFALTFGGSGGIRVSRNLISLSSLTMNGTGVLALSGNNTFTGPVFVNAGAITLQGGSALADSVAVTIGSAGQLATANLETIGSVAGNGRLDISAGTLSIGANNASTEFSGRLTGQGTLVKVGTGTLTLSGDTTWSGGTTISAGMLQIGNGGTTGTLGTGAVTNNAALTFNRAGILEVAGAIGGTGVLTQSGPGITALTGANNYSGATTISAGTLQIGNGGTTGSLGSGAVTNNATLAINLSSDITLAQVITGTGALRKLGTGGATITSNLVLGSATVEAGTLALSGSNSFTNGITVAGGTLALRSTNAAGGAAGIIRTTGSVIDYSDGLVMATPIQLNSNTTQLQVLTGSATQSGVISEIGGARPLEKIGAGTLTLAGVNSYSGGTVITAGRLNVASSSNLGNSAGGLTIGNAVLGITATFGSGRAVSLTGAAGIDVALGASLIQSGLVSGLGGLTKTGAGTLFLTANNSYAGTTTISGLGGLTVGANGTTGSLGAGTITINPNSNLTFRRSDNVTLANIITGAGIINQNGAGTLNLGFTNSNGNDFTGTINVNSGILRVSGSIGDAASRVAQINVANGATLAGSGTFNGNVVVANGGILAPGTSPGTQTIAGNLTLNNSSALNFELAQAGVVGGGINDLISVGGNLTLDGTLNVTALPGFGAGYYRLFNYGGTLINNQLGIGTLPLGFTSSILTDIAGQVNVLFNAGTQMVQYWDGADLTGATATVNGEGGAGNWSSTSTNWTNPTGFAVNSAWAGQAGVFAGAAGGNVSVTGTQAFQELRFLTNGYTLNPIGPTGGLATTGGFSIINVDTGISTQLNTPISGTAGLTKAGAGTLSLAGANTYSGLTTVSSGTLSLLSSGTIAGSVTNNAILTSTGSLLGGLTNNAGATANLAGAINGAVSNAGAFNVTGALTNNSAITNTGTVTLTGATLTTLGLTNEAAGIVNAAGAINGQVTNNGTFNVTGNLTGNTGFGNAGAGVLAVSGGNYTGLTVITNNSNALNGINVAANRTLGAQIITNAPTASILNTGTITVSNRIDNSGTLTTTGTINGGSTGLRGLAGSSINAAGTINGAVSNAGAFNVTGTLTNNSAITNTGTVTLTGATLTTLGLTNEAAGIVNAAGAINGQVTNNGTFNVTGNLTGNTGFGNAGAGVLAVSGGNYTGLTVITNNSNALNGINVAANRTLGAQIITNAPTASILNTGTITVSNRIDNSGTLTTTGTINGLLNNSAGGIVNLRGTLTGAVSNSGTINLTGLASGISTFTQSATGVFNLGGNATTIGSFAGSGAVQLGSGTLTTGGNSASTSFAGAISGSGGFIKTGSGTLTLSGANGYTGLTTVSAGALNLSAGASLAGAVQNSATFTNAGTVAGLVTNTGTLTSNGTLGGGLVNNAAANANIAGALNGAVTNSGTITLSGATTGIGAFSQNTGGVFNLAGFSTGIGSLSGTGAVQLGSGTLTTGGNNASTTFDGIVSGSGGLIKTGTGTLTLGGSNTAVANFTGNVSVNSGTLLINGQFGDTVANAASLTVANGATLGGSGNFLGNIALGAGSILAPGNSPGTLAIGGNLLLDSTSVLNFELAQAGVVGGGINDLITVGGNLTLDGTLNVTSLPGFGAGIYRLFNYGGTLTNNGLALGTLPGGLTSSLVTGVAGQVSIQFSLGVPTILYWDGADTTGASAAANGDGGAGTWNSAATNWTSAPGFNTNFAWGSQTGVFAGAAGGAVSIAGMQAFQQLRFETGGYVLSAAAGGGGLTTTGGLSIIDVSTGFGATINAPISGTAGLTKAGTGTLTLGGANSYAGLTSIAAGTLAVSAGGTIAGAVENNATFNNAGTVAGLVTNTGGLISTGALNGGLTNAAGATSALAGTVTGAVSNAGAITLTGTTTGIGAMTQTGTGSLNLAGFNTTIGSLSGSGSVQLSSATLTTGGNNASTSFAGVISGSGGLTKTGTGTLTLSAANGYGGPTLIAGGALTITSAGSLAGSVFNNATLNSVGTLNGLLTNEAGATANISGALNNVVINRGAVNLTGTTTGISDLIMATGSVFNLGGFATTIGTLAGGGGTVALGSATLTLGSGNQSQTYDGTITGTGGLIKVGANTFSLSGAQAYTGLTSINGGTLILGSSASLAGGLVNNATVANSGNIAGLVTNNAALISTGALTGGLINGAGATANLRGTVAGAISNAGTITLTGATTAIGAVTQAGTGSFVLGSINTSFGSLAGSGTVRLANGAVLTTGGNNASTTFAGVITGTGGLTKTGTGTFTLTGANDFTGLATVNSGALVIGTGGSLAGGVANNATFTNAGTVTGAVTNAGNLLSTGTMSGSLTNTAGALAQISGQLNNAVTNAGNIALTGATTGIGAFSLVAGGTFDLAGNSTSVGSLSGAGTVQLGSATLTTGGDNSSTSFAGAIAGAGGLTKLGEGTFTLSGVNSYTGLTTVAAGALNIQSNAALGSADGGTIVNAGAALELQGGITVTGEALAINGSGIANGGALRNVAGNTIWAGPVTLGSDARIVTVTGRLDIDLLAGTTQNLAIAGTGLTGITAATTAGTLTVVEGSTALFGSSNFASGVNVNAGNLFLQGGTSINDAAAVTLGTGNLIVAVSETIGSLAGGGTVQIDAGQSLTLGGNGASTSFGGVIFNTGNLVKQGAGTFTATGTLAHTGTTNINGGTLLSGAANLWQGNGLVTIANGGTLNLGGFDQSIANIALAGGTLTNGVLTGAITSSGGTINGIAGGANALVTTTGTTTLTGAGSFALGVTLSGGDLSLQGSGASIADAAAVTINAGTLTLGASETIGSLAGGAGRIELGSATLTTGGDNSSTSFAGAIAGAGGLTKLGAGTFTLSGANSYTGSTMLSGGVLALATGGAIAGAVQNNAGFSNAGTVAGLVTNEGALVSTGTLNGGLVNSGGASLAGVLNGAVSNSGLTQLQGALTGIGALSQTASGTFDLAGFNTSIGSLSGAGSVQLGSATLTTGGNNGSTSFGGLISGAGGLVKTGSGTFTLTSGHSFAGLTTVSGGTLAITNTGGLTGSVLNNATFASAGLVLGGLTNNAAALLAGQINGAITNNSTMTSTGEALFLGRLNQAANAVFTMAGFNTQAGSLAGAGTIQLGSGVLTVGSDNSSSTFAGVIGGSGGLVKIGTGTFTLLGVNSYGGTTFVDAGELVIGDGTAAGATVASIGAVGMASSPALVATPIVAAEATPDTQAAGQTAGGTVPVVIVSVVADAPEQAASLTRADMVNPGNSLGGGGAPVSLTSSAAGVALSANLQSGLDRVVLFGEPATETAITAPVLADAVAASAATVTVSDAATVSRQGMNSSLGNSLGTASLNSDRGAASLDADALLAIVPGPEAVSLAAVPAAGAENVAQAGPPSTAVIAGNVVNNAIVINNGTIRGQLANGAGATTTNNGVISGTVFNDGLLLSTGTLSGGLSNTGTARIQGVLTGDVFNTGAITLTGTTTGIGVFQQGTTGTLNLAGFDTTLGVLSGAGTVALGSARLTTGTNGVSSMFSGVISGAGSLIKTGTGALILMGENLYTGGTSIAAGVLQLGDGGTGGSILGPVTNNSTLIVNRSNAYSLVSAISGTGMFVQGGTGTTTLVGANTYTGGTLISAGRLMGSTASLQGLIQNDAALEFAQATNGVFAGRIGGSGLLDKTGAGLLELTGDNSALRGATTVRIGELRVTGSLAGSATTVLSGATLSGTGTLGGLVARSGSVVSPGNGTAGTAGLGALGVNGAIQLQSGSTLRLQIQAASGSDVLVGNAGAQIGGTAAITNLGGTYAFNSRYLLLQANSRSGTFDNVTGFADFGILYRPELVYTANQVLLRLAPNLLANIVGAAPLTANQRSVVSRIDTAVTAGYNPQPLFNVYSLPTTQLPGAFDQLSGEIYATAAGVGIEQERLVREAVLGRIGTVASASREAPELGTGAGAWAQLFGSWGDGDGDSNASRFENDGQGFITGVDYGSANSEGSWRIGAFGLNMTNKISVDRLGSRAEVEQTGGGIYAGVNSGGFSVMTGVAVTEVDLTSVRNIALPGFTETNRGRGDGRALQGFTELSYSIEAGKSTYRPFVSAAAGSFKLDAMTENGGAAALVVRRQSYASGSITAGIDGTIRMDKLLLSGTLAGRAQIGDQDPQALVALAAAPAQAFGIRGVQLDSFALAARLDATVSLSNSADLAVGYTGLIGNDTKDHGARVSLSIRF